MIRRIALAILAASLCGCAARTPWGTPRQTLTVTGTAQDAKMGALVDTDRGQLWLDGVDTWPDDLRGRKVRVTGTLIQRGDLPVFIPKEGEAPKAGIPVPEGTDMQKAKMRCLLEKPKWERVE